MTEAEFQRIKSDQREREERDRIAQTFQPATKGDILELMARLDRIEQMLLRGQSIHDWSSKQLSPYLNQDRS